MTEHTIPITDELYQMVQKRAELLQTTPEAVLNQLAHTWIGLTDEADDDPDMLDEPARTDAALAAVNRLTHLFADVTIPDFDQIVADPMLALDNSSLLAPNHGEDTHR